MSRRKHNHTGRGSNALSDFVAIERYIMRSPAWRSLSAVEQAAYVQLGYRYTGTNNGGILLSTSQLAKALHTSKAKASRCLKNLMAKGFIDQVKGASFNSKIRHCAEWRLTAFRCNASNALPSKTFMRWQPEIQKSVSPRNDTVSPQVPIRKKDPEKPLNGFTADTVTAKNELPTVSPQAPFYNSNHRRVATHSVPSDGAATPEASATRDNVEIKQSDDCFQTFGAVALKALAQLQTDLPDNLQSWASTASKQILPNTA